MGLKSILWLAGLLVGCQSFAAGTCTKEALITDAKAIHVECGELEDKLFVVRYQLQLTAANFHANQLCPMDIDNAMRVKLSYEDTECSLAEGDLVDADLQEQNGVYWVDDFSHRQPAR